MLDDMDGKVAIVTGAGRGLGRAEAMELARLGVRVVVNDFGTELDGTPSDNPADEVVEEIRAAGGTAVAHRGDVADWDDSRALFELALSEFGRLDILVNNAGVLRDRMLFNMTPEDWDLVMRVHLRGHFCMTRHAVAYWRARAKAGEEQVYGRVVNTTSESGLMGAVGQPNYAAAKAGIASFTVAVAQTLAKYGVTANAIAPRARTRMTLTLGSFQGDGEFDTFAPENVSPLVAYLASPAASHVNGQVFVVWGKTISVIAGPSVDRAFEAGDAWTPKSVAEQLTPFYETRTPITDGFTIRF